MEHAPRFELENAAALLVNMNTRMEKHGEENKLACDLNFEYETANTAMAMFAPALRSCMYIAPDDVQGQLVEDADYLPQLRFPGLGLLKWEVGELIGAKLTFTYGVKDSKLEFPGVKVHKFRLLLKEGGSVVISFQVQVHPAPQQVGKLTEFFQGTSVNISIEPPKGDEEDTPAHG